MEYCRIISGTSGGIAIILLVAVICNFVICCSDRKKDKQDKKNKQ